MLAGKNGRGVPDAQEVAAVIDPRDGVELGDGLRRDTAGAENPRVRHQQVEPAVEAHDLIEAGRHGIVVGDIERDTDGPPGTEPRSQRLRLAIRQFGVDIGEHDVAALGYEIGRDRMPKALGRARHDGNQPSGAPGDRRSGCNTAAILLGLPTLDELPLGLRQRTDSAEAMRIDCHAGRIQEDLAYRFCLRVGVARSE